ncbi:hypothetical protein EZY14_003080 [Kordia sp. TARA_039_SRF]|jgi:hypothetical protein|nr:hypothetical protein EZY14_003080 [Kordia sp. TARA_039_SRF]
MKKRNLKALTLNKKSISSFNPNVIEIKGGASDTGRVCCDPNFTKDCPPIEIPTIDIPTINDSCFSLCNNKCNDF